MRKHRVLFRLTATTALVGVVVGSFPAPGLAQTAPPPVAPLQAPEPAQATDPPARVGRLAHLHGAVSFHGPGAAQWDRASANFPVTSGDAVWTQPGAGADIDLGRTRLAIDQSTELDIGTLDGRQLAATLPQGRVYLHVGRLAPGEAYTLATPRGTVSITAPGRYEIAAGDTDTPTRIAVLDGAAQVSGSAGEQALGPGQEAVLTGTDPVQMQVTEAARDPFADAELARERPAGSGGVAPPPVVADMTGSADLTQIGTWQDNPSYGAVWYPPVATDWVPYRTGHWAYVVPWGWTWIDDAPWGFTPFHYGRWVEVNGRWAWAPIGYVEPVYAEPVYAPALVTFFGIGLAVGIGVGLAAGAWAPGGRIGWCPLGWHEPYRPWYRASPAYIQAVNVPSVRNVTNITNVTNVTTINNYANAGAATVVPAATMTGSRPVGPQAQTLPPSQLGTARPILGRDPVPPGRATAGVTPRVAQALHLPPAPAGRFHPAAPGPAMRAGVGPAAGSPVTSALTRGTPPAADHPAPAMTPAAPPLTHPVTAGAMPALRTPAETARPPQIVPHPLSAPLPQVAAPSEPHPFAPAAPARPETPQTEPAAPRLQAEPAPAPAAAAMARPEPAPRTEAAAPRLQAEPAPALLPRPEPAPQTGPTTPRLQAEPAPQHPAAPPEMPHIAATPAPSVPHPAAPAASAPAPVVRTPPPVAASPPPVAFHTSPAPVVQPSAPQPAFRPATAPPQAYHPAPAPQQAFRPAPSPPPVAHTPPPVVHAPAPSPARQQQSAGQDPARRGPHQG